MIKSKTTDLKKFKEKVYPKKSHIFKKWKKGYVKYLKTLKNSFLRSSYKTTKKSYPIKKKVKREKTDILPPLIQY